MSRRCIGAPAAVRPGGAAGGRRGYCNDPRHREKLEKIEELRWSIYNLAGPNLFFNTVSMSFVLFVADFSFHFFYDRRHSDEL